LSSSNRIGAPQLGQFISTDISDSANPDRQHPTTMAIRKDGRQLDCELRDYGAWGVEVQVYREREFLYGRRWATVPSR
jgi:hypothetical protein